MTELTTQDQTALDSSELLTEIELVDDQAVTTSLEVAKHFGKLHKNVIRDIESLEIPEDLRKLIFEPTFYDVDGPNDSTRQEPAIRMTRDGFTLLVMGFTGKKAMRWKIAYIHAFNEMERRLREEITASVLEYKDIRKGMKLRDIFKLQEQSHQTAVQISRATDPMVKRNLYWQLRHINRILGVPYPSLTEVIGKTSALTLYK